MQISDLILKADTYSDEQIAAISAEVARRPYFHAASLTLASALYDNQAPQFGGVLQRTAIGVPDRNMLFQRIEGDEYSLDDIPPKSKARHRRLTIVDSTTDYMAYLMQSEDAASDVEDALEMRGQSLIDNFIDNNAQGERIQLAAEPQVNPAVGNAIEEEEKTIARPRPKTQKAEAAENNEEDILPEYFTETMARIYIKQGKFEKASKIIGRLNAKYPKKNRYFADQMRFLEKLKLNQRCQNEEN